MSTAAAELVCEPAQLRDLVERVHSVPTLLVSIPDGRVAASSPSARALLGLSSAELVDRPVSTIMRGVWRSASMRLLLSGGLTTFSAAASIRRADGELVLGTVWAGTFPGCSDRWVVLGMAVDGEDAGSGMPLLLGNDDEPVVLGRTNGTGGFAEISLSVEDVLGYDAPTFLGLTVAGIVHADDLPAVLSASMRVSMSGRTASVLARLRHADGRWLPIRVFVAQPSGGSAPGLAFSFVREAARGPVSTSAEGERAAELEVRLRRIALELAAVGVFDGLGPNVSPDVAEALGDLPPRQQEIVRRLQAGERVPTIAEAMFLSQSTVRNHLSAVFRRFGVSSQEALVQLLLGRR